MDPHRFQSHLRCFQSTLLSTSSNCSTFSSPFADVHPPHHFHSSRRDCRVLFFSYAFLIPFFPPKPLSIIISTSSFPLSGIQYSTSFQSIVLISGKDLFYPSAFHLPKWKSWKQRFFFSKYKLMVYFILTAKHLLERINWLCV